MSVSADLGKVGHAFVVGAEKLKAAVIAASSFLQKEAPEVATLEALANGVAETIYPGASTVATSIEAVLGKVFDAVDAAGDAASANGLSLTLDQATVTAIKAALPIVKAQAVTTPGS